MENGADSPPLTKSLQKSNGDGGFKMLRKPRLTIPDNYASILQAFQDLSCIGEMRQRWVEIKRLRSGKIIVSFYLSFCFPSPAFVSLLTLI